MYQIGLLKVVPSELMFCFVFLTFQTSMTVKVIHAAMEAPASTKSVCTSASAAMVGRATIVRSVSRASCLVT